jgi:DNA polymerase I
MKFEKEKTVYIIDINYYLYAGHFGVHLTCNGVPIGGTYSTVRNLLRLCKLSNYVIAALDSDYCFKKERVGNYKAHRPHTEAIKYQREALVTFINAMNIPLVRMHGFEADDIIATLVTAYNKNERPCVIVGRDKDLFALINESTFMLNITTGKYYNVEEVKNVLGVPPEKVEDYLAIVGDAADGFKGIPKIGPKGACELLREFGDVRGILENWENLPDKYKARVKTISALNSFRESIVLATLDRNVQGLRKFHDPVPHNINVDKFNELCEYHGFKSLIIKENEKND